MWWGLHVGAVFLRVGYFRVSFPFCESLRVGELGNWGMDKDG